MNAIITQIGAVALLVLAATVVQAASPARTGALPTAANLIVGTWEAQVQLGPCGGPLNPPFLATTVFHAGGTLSETNAAPLGGIPTPFGQSVRGPGFGTWDYDSRTATYTAQVRFNWYVNGFYHGYQQIEFEGLVLSMGDSVMTGTISAERHFVSGNPPAPNCGIVTQKRTP